MDCINNRITSDLIYPNIGGKYQFKTFKPMKMGRKTGIVVLKFNFLVSVTLKPQFILQNDYK